MPGLFDASEFSGVVDELIDTARRNAAGQARMVATVAREGARATRGSAKRTARRHGKHYPRSIKARRLGPLTWEWAPQSGPQSDMSFEEGSRNQPPHRNHAKVADVIEPKFAPRAGDTAHDAFPGSWQ